MFSLNAKFNYYTYTKTLLQLAFEMDCVAHKVEETEYLLASSTFGAQTQTKYLCCEENTVENLILTKTV